MHPRPLPFAMFLIKKLTFLGASLSQRTCSSNKKRNMPGMTPRGAFPAVLISARLMGPDIALAPMAGFSY